MTLGGKANNSTIQLRSFNSNHDLNCDLEHHYPVDGNTMTAILDKLRSITITITAATHRIDIDLHNYSSNHINSRQINRESTYRRTVISTHVHAIVL